MRPSWQKGPMVRTHERTFSPATRDNGLVPHTISLALGGEMPLRHIRDTRLC